MKTKDLKKYLEIGRDIEERATEIIDYLYPRDTYRGTKYDGYELNNKKQIFITWKSYAGCGSYDYDTVEMDFKTFTNDNWKELIKK